MMPRYIDTEDFKHLINASSLYDTEEWVKVMDLLAETPTAYVRKNVHGKWKLVDNENYAGGGYYECSACGHQYSYGGYFELDECGFCPNCGADMREESDDVSNC